MALALLLALTAACGGDTSVDTTLPPPRPLDESHAAEFVQAFNEAQALPRYVVALSPT